MDETFFLKCRGKFCRLLFFGILGLTKVLILLNAPGALHFTKKKKKQGVGEGGDGSIKVWAQMFKALLA